MKKVFTKQFKSGEKCSGTIGRNKYIYFKALVDKANLSLLLYNIRNTSERYNSGVYRMIAVAIFAAVSMQNFIICSVSEICCGCF